ncbi:MAG: ATP-binding protein [Clostridia bacterium]|nr:ATP-binding protein [Clostridia bacterium]
MGYSERIYQRASETLEKRKADAEFTAKQNKMHAESLIPRLKELDREISSLGLSVIKAIGMKENAEEFVQRLSQRSLEAQEERRRLLIDAGLPEDFLTVKYSCSKCSDTGFVGGYRCECYGKLLKSIAYKELCDNFPIEKSTFDTFKLGFYSKATDPHTGVVPHDRMSDILNFCKAYAKDFDLRSQSIFMYGETGLGKTHLSLAIAGEVVRKGYGVIYGSAQNLFSKIEKEHFSRDNDEDAASAVLNCDLLIIDDLGAEFSTQFSVSALYNIINTRMQSGLPVIISTNLPVKEFESRYTRRVTSRIFGSFTTLAFCGSDIRQILR